MRESVKRGEGERQETVNIGRERERVCVYEREK
jgi:hypothetical protein